MEVTPPKYDLHTDATRRLQAIIETAIDGIITIDERGTVETINPAAARLFGYEPEEVIGQNINMLMPNPYHDEHDQYIKNYLQTKVPHIIGIGREVEGRRKDGLVFPLRLAVSETLLENRRIFTGIIHDLTDVKTAENNIRRLNEELERKVNERTKKLAEVVNRLIDTNRKLQHEIQERKSIEQALLKSQQELQASLEKEKELNELKSRFVSMASHEFRTPLSTILSSTDLVEAYTQTEQQDKRERHTKRIRAAVSNLTSILNDFLSLSKLEEGKIEQKIERFTVGELCKEVFDSVQGMKKPNQQLLHEGLADDTPLITDYNYLKNIMINLLSNAIKYSDDGKLIRCVTILENKRLIVKIIDQGIGIPEEDQQHLFTRFFRAHNAENIQGTGLGLNIVRHYVDLLNGTISFKSTMGAGTTFTVKIPLRDKVPLADTTAEERV